MHEIRSVAGVVPTKQETSHPNCYAGDSPGLFAHNVPCGIWNLKKLFTVFVNVINVSLFLHLDLSACASPINRAATCSNPDSNVVAFYIPCLAMIVNSN